MSPAPTLYGKGQLPRETSRNTLGLLHGGLLCLDFVNTVDDHGAGGNDQFAPGYVNIVEWFVHAGVVDDEAARRLLLKAGKEPREAAAVRKRATSLRSALFEIVSALTISEDPQAESLALFNQEIQHSLASGGFVFDGVALAWQWNEGNDLDRMLWDVSRSAADLFSSSRLARVRQCAAPACQKFFLDASKNRSRRFCSSATCGTAARVRRFRERQKSTP